MARLPRQRKPEVKKVATRNRPGPGGSRAGVPDRIQYGRRIQGSIKAIMQEIVETEPLTVRQAIRRGFKAGPKFSHHFIKLAVGYTDGTPTSHLDVKFNEDEVKTAKDTLSKKLDGFLNRLVDLSKPGAPVKE
jgi:hypothetical protein